MLSKSLVIKPTRYFNNSKEKTNKFFKNTKVGSCSHVLVRNGSCVAVPYKITNSKGLSLNNYKMFSSQINTFKSVYRTDYTGKASMYIGMTKKPLVPYDPNCYRNRLAINDPFILSSNKSNFNIGDSGIMNRKQWISTSKDSFVLPQIIPISNSGILSELSKQIHKRIESTG